VKLPVCLCDRYVDFMRSCYRTMMFFPGVGEVEIQYYFTPPGARPLEFPTCYNSLNWWDGPERPPGTPGEVQGAKRSYASGRDPGGECDGVKGDADAWKGKPGPLLECIKNPLAKGGIEIGGQSIHSIADEFIAGDGGGSGNGEGTFAQVLLGGGGGSGNGEGEFGSGGDDMPIGAIYWFGSTTPPADHLVCDGSAVSRSTYATLFAIIGTTFGAGDGSTTFTLPNLASRSVVGSGTGSGLSGRTLAATGGEENHVLTTSEIPAHTHPQDAATVIGPGSTRPVDVGLTPNTALGGTTQSSGGGGSHNTMHPFLVLVPIIRYQ